MNVYRLTSRNGGVRGFQGRKPWRIIAWLNCFISDKTRRRQDNRRDKKKPRYSKIKTKKEKRNETESRSPEITERMCAGLRVEKRRCRKLPRSQPWPCTDRTGTDSREISVLEHVYRIIVGAAEPHEHCRDPSSNVVDPAGILRCARNNVYLPCDTYELHAHTVGTHSNTKCTYIDIEAKREHVSKHRCKIRERHACASETSSFTKPSYIRRVVGAGNEQHRGLQSLPFDPAIVSI